MADRDDDAANGYGSGGVYESRFTFRGYGYLVQLCVPGVGEAIEPFSLALRGLGEESEEWRAQFTPAEVEHMTSKTGEFQSFPEMAAMLVSLVRGKANGLAINNSMPYAHKNPAFNNITMDVLTYADLELLKQRRAGASAPPSAGRETPRAAGRRALNKRYVIITVGSNRNEDDKIHYPLPLPFVHVQPPPPPPQPQVPPPVEIPVVITPPTKQAISDDVHALKAQIARLSQSMTAKPSATSPPPIRPATREMFHSASAIDVRPSFRQPHQNGKQHSSSRDHSPRDHRSHSTRHRSSSRREPDADLQRNAAQEENLLAIKHLAHPTRHSAMRQKQHHIKGDHSERSEIDIEDASPAMIRLEAQLSATQEQLAFEKQVSQQRIQALESENRALRRKEKDAVAQLTEAQHALSLITLESDRLKAQVVEFMQTTRVAGSPAPAPAQGRGRSRGVSPSLVRDTSSALPPIRSASPSQLRISSARSASSRTASPYLQAQRDRRAAVDSGRNSPVISGRNTPTRGGSAASSPMRRPAASPYAPPPMQHSASARTHSRSPGPFDATPSRNPRTPSDLSYGNWSSGRATSPGPMPLRRFNPSEYVAMKAENLARKAREMEERNRAEIARVTRPGLTTTGNRRGTSPSPSRVPPLSPSLSASGSFSNSWRGRRTPPPAFEYVDSPGRAGPVERNHPSGYVAGANDRARSLRFPLDTKQGRKGPLSRSSSVGSVDGFTFSRPTHLITTPMGMSSYTGDRDGFLEMDEMTRSTRTTPYRSSSGLPRADDSFASDLSHSTMEPLIPVLSTVDIEDDPVETPRPQSPRRAGPPESVDQVQAITNRLAKLQEYLAAEKEHGAIH